MKKNNTFKRFLAFLLCAAMIVTYMPSSVYTLADESVDDSAVVQEEPEAAPAEEKAEEPAKEAETPKVESAPKEESSEPAVAEEPAAEEPKETVEEPSSGGKEEADKPSEEPSAANEQAEEPAQDAEADVTEPEQEEESEEEDTKYPEQDFAGATSDVDVTVHAPKGELPEGTTMKVKNVSASTVNSAVKEEMGENAKVVKAVDITFYDKDGKEIQPKGDKPLSVSFNSSKFAKNDDLSVVHIDDNKNAEKVADKLVENNGEEVAFKADQFSVYVVVETVVPRLTVNFVNGSTNIETMYVKAADTAEEVEKIIYDPGVGEIPSGQVFKGWTTVQDYTSESTFMTIDQVRSDAMTKAAALDVADDSVTYYAAMFKQYTVTYVDGENITVGTEVAEIPSRDSEATYTVNMGYTTDDSHNFEGWIVADGESNVKNYPEGAQTETIDGEIIYYYENGTAITITGDVKFSVDAPEGYWLVFDENGKGATYNAPRFIKAGDVTSDEDLLDMVRNGYTFVDWYTGAPSEPEGDPTGSVFEFGNPLTETTTIYAKWQAKERANYTVIIWKQHVDGEYYDFQESVTVQNALVGSTPNVVNSTTGRVNGGSYTGETGFHFKETDQASKRVAPEGNTVVNVYWDRNEITFNFNIYGYTYTATTDHDNNPAKYGTNDGITYFRVYSRSNNTVWSTSQYGTVTQANTYTGTVYTRSNGQSWHVYETMSGLYGSTLEENGYEWPAEYDWYETGGNNGSTSGTRTTFLDAFLPTSTATTVNFYGSAPAGSNHIYFYKQNANGNGYTLANTVNTNATGFNLSDKYNGFKCVAWNTSNNTSNWNVVGELMNQSGNYYYDANPNQSGYQTASIGNNGLHIYFDRLSYKILFYDGSYFDGNNNPIEESSQGEFKEVDNVTYGASLTSYNKGGADYYEPTAPAGYVFEGWYIDDACTHPYTFNTMPEGGLTVYAKWRQIQYRVFLHPNAGTDNTLDWGSDLQGMNFRVSYGSKISPPQGLRTGYEFYGWYTDEALTKAFTPNTVLNESTVNGVYDKTTDFTDPMDKWGNGATSNADVDRFWITKKFDLYAKWSAIIVGADGIGVIYDANGGSNAPSDTALYKDNSIVTAGAAATAPSGKVFDHWVLQTWNGSEYADTDTTVPAGGTFSILKSDAKITDAETEEVVNPSDVVETGHYKYTVQLKAVYKDLEEETPTYIRWYSNYGSENDGKGTLYRADDNIKINQAVYILGAQTRDGYDFKGWTKTKGGTTADFLAWDGSKYTATIEGSPYDATQVAADEKDPKEDLFAVWEEKEVTITYAVAEDSKDMGTVDPVSETVKVATGTAVGSTATEASNMYVFDYWTVDDGTDPVSTATHFTPEKNASGLYEEHTYYAHFKLNKAEVTVHHYLKGTEIKVAEDNVTQETIGTEYTATPVTTYQEKDLTVDSYNPSQTVTVSAEGNVITIYYTLPLTITAKTAGKTYDGTPLNGEFTVTGQLESDETAINTAIGTAPSITYVSESPEEYQAGTTGIPGYYVITNTPGTLTINKRPITITAESDSKVYDGNPLTKDAVEDVTLAGDDVLDSVTVTGTITLVGSVPNVPSAAVIKNGDTDVTDNYAITYANGTLTITDENVKPELVVIKNDTKADDYKYTEGEVVTFNISVKNIYAEAKTITLAEIDGVTLAQSEFADVAAGETVTTTATYTITATDMATGSFTNTVTATLEDKTYQAQDTVNTEAITNKLTVTKAAEPASGLKKDDIVTYTVTVKNEGNATLTDVTLSDTLVILTDDQKAIGILTPDQSKEIEYTYKVTQGDVDAGKVDNTATAAGKDPKGTEVTGTASKTVTTEAPAPALAVTKTASKTIDAAAGDEITYTVTVKNTGNVTLTGVTLTDTLVTLTGDKSDLGTLVPNDEKTIIYTYTVLQKDVDAGSFDNTATATGNPPTGEAVSDNATATVNTVTADPKLTVTKTASKTENAAAGDVITYTVKVKNDGNVTVSDIALSDTLVTLSAQPFTLAPTDEAKTFTYTYTVTQADVDKGKIDNTVTAAGKDPKDGDVTETASAAVTTVEQTPALTVTKSANPASGVGVGAVVTYTVVVTNSGNVTVKDIELEDTLVTLTEDQFELAPQGTKTITYTYTVTQGDVDAGKIDNTVTATGKDPKNEDVTKSATATVTTVESDAKIEVTKTASKTTDASVDDVITYTVVVTNSGNVTVKDIELEDTLVTLTEDQFELAPQGTKTITYTYTVTQADVDAGKIDNTVTATGKDPKNKEVSNSANATVTAVEAKAELTVDKSAAPTSGLKAGDNVTYTVKVINSGNVTVSGITLTDTKMAAADVPTAFTLAPGAEKEITYTYTVTQGDVDAGKIDNTVTATGKDPKNSDVTAEDDASVTTVEAAPALTVTKSANPASGVGVDAVVTYTVVVTNSGNVTVSGIDLADNLMPADKKPAAFNLAPGENKEITYTYTVLQKDVDTGKIDNTVTATGKDPAGEEVTNSATVSVEAEAATPDLTATKAAVPHEDVKVGDIVTYTVVVTNSGNVTVSGIAMADSLVTLDEAAYDLAPGESKEITYTYTVLQKDVDAGKIDNEVAAAGTYKVAPVLATANATVTTVKADAKLTVEKTASPTSGLKVGETVTYTVVVTNSGNVTVKGIAVDDPKFTPAPAAFDLGPGGTNSFTYTYRVTQADVDAGKIENTATATGKDPSGENVTAKDDAIVTTVEADPALTVVKTASPTSGLKVGETVTYTVVVTNSGNVTVKDIAMSDTLVTLTEAPFDLAPEESKTITYTYTVTQADVDKGQIENTATATGKDPSGESVIASDDATVTTVKAAPAITVDKSASPAEGLAVDGVVTYTVVVTNAGNVTLSGIELEDTLVDLEEETFELEPAGTRTITYTYTVVQADVDAGMIENTVTATGTDPFETEVSANDSATVTTVDSEAVLTVTKSADPEEDVAVGDEITYTVTVANEGNVTITGVALEDSLVELPSSDTAVGTLAPKASKTITYTYTVTQADVDAGKIDNTVTATGTDNKNNTLNTSANVTVPTVEAEAELTVEKTAAPTEGLEVGKTVSYTVVVTNSGNVTVSNITVADAKMAAADAPAAFKLAPGAEKEITYTYTVTQADVDAGKIENTAIATGNDPAGEEVTASDNATVTTVAAEGELTVEKTAAPTEGLEVGKTVSYTVVVTNSGNVTVSNITVADAKMAAADAPAAFTLAPGAEKEITYTYTVTQADVDAGSIENTATATGTDPAGEEVTASDDATVETVTAAPALSVVKTADPEEGVEVGDTVTYTVVVTNSGNVTVSGIAVSDPKFTPAPAAFNLAPAGTQTFTYTYTVTQADVDAGSIENTVAATGTYKATPVLALDSATVTTVEAAPELTVTKTADPDEDVEVGNEIDYTVVVENSGNVTVSDITLADVKMAAADAPVAFTLAPGEEKAITYTYTVTQADVDAGIIENTATATGNDSSGTRVTASDSATVATVAAESSLSVTKTADPASNVAAGDTITYTVVVKNTGNVSVSAGTLEDDHADLSARTFNLAPGAEASFTYTYKVTQDDIDAGEIVNVVKANATAARGEAPDEATATATVTAEEADAAIAVSKLADPTEDVAEGDEITYTVVVTNTGNVSVTDGTLEDDHADLSDKTFSLVPGGTAEFEYTYKVTQDDVDAGEIVNIVKANATAERGDDPSEVTATATVAAEEAEPALTVTKTADPTDDIAEGDEIEYTVVVTNSGNVTVSDITLADTKMAAADAPEAFTLAPGAAKTVTYKYTATQADIDAGVINNTVTAKGTDPKNNEVTGTASAQVKTEAAESSLSITKTASQTEGVSAGDEIQYTVVVTNTGNVSVENGALNDDHADLSGETFSLAPDASATFNYTYTVQQSDIDTGSFTNTVTANAEAVRGDDPDEVEASVTVTAEAAGAALSITKTADPTEDAAVGDEITYTVVVTNAGNVSVTDGTLDDDHADLADKTFALAPGETAEFEYTYSVTQADVDAGSITNIVKANAEAVRGDDPEEVTASAIVAAEEKNASLLVEKETTSEPENGETYALGETIEYKITVTNNGNVTISNVQVTDELTHGAWAAEDDLAPGESAEFTTSYTVTEADILAGSVANEAVAKGTDPQDEPTEDSGTTEDPTDPKNGHLTITKETTSATPADGYALGDTITYSITVTNDGNLTITDITVEDELTGDEWKVASLAPGASKSFTAEYTVTEADILAGEVVNVATGEGTSPDPDEPEVPVTPGEDPEPTEEPDGHLTVTKTTTSEAAAEDGKYALGETITYEIIVTNDGNLTITDITVEDELTGDEWTVASLAPGASQSFTAEYTVQEADIIAGEVLNVATAEGKSPDPDEPEVPVTPGEDPEPTADPFSKLNITKAADPTKDVAVGDEVTYTVVVKNEGNVTVKDGKLVDDHVDLSKETFELAPDASKEFTYTYKVTQDDVDAGKIVNIVIANATPAAGDAPEEVEATATVTTVKADPSISVEKSSDKVEGKDVAAGDTITYTVVVKNTGNVTLSNVTLEDAKMAEADAPEAFKLAPDEEKTITYTYTVTDTDDEAGLVTNTATATGNPPQNLDPVSDSDTEETVVGHNDITPTPDPGDEDEEMDAEGKSVTVMYDGHPHTVSAEATRPGSTIWYSTDGGETWSKDAPTRTIVGFTDFSIKATNEAYEDVVKDGYKLVVTKRPITFESASDEKVYDGTPLVRNNPRTDISIGGEGLANTDKVTFDITGSQTYVGSSENLFTYEFGKETSPASRALNAIKDYFTAYGGDEAVTLADNYEVEVIYGELTVTDKGVDNDKVIQKTHEGKKYKAGDTITFTIKATNIYDEEKTITLEEQAGVTLAQSVFEGVAPGQTIETTATYKVTEADIKSGKFTNVVKAKFSGEDNEYTGTDTVDDFHKPSGGGNGPDTGDNGFGFELTMMFGSAAAFLAMFFGRRRREQE